MVTSRTVSGLGATPPKNFFSARHGRSDRATGQILVPVPLRGYAHRGVRRVSGPFGVGDCYGRRKDVFFCHGVVLRTLSIVAPLKKSTTPQDEVLCGGKFGFDSRPQLVAP